MLFGDWLEETRKLQEEFYNHVFPMDNLEERAEFFREQAAAVLFEIGEMSNEISWKSWASEHFLNRKAYIGEAVDALHFLANLLLVADCTREELNEAYLEKMERNRQRMMSGTYTGRDKCPGCKRDWGDIKAHHEGLLERALVSRGKEQIYICMDCYRRGRTAAEDAG